MCSVFPQALGWRGASHRLTGAVLGLLLALQGTAVAQIAANQNRFESLTFSPQSGADAEIVQVGDAWLQAPWELQPGFYAGADYLFVRPTITESSPFLVGQSSGGQIRGEFIHYDFDFQSSPRAFLGYRLPNAGAVQFTYWHYDNSASVSHPLTEPGEFLLLSDFSEDPFFDALGTQATSTMRLRFNLFDVDFLRPLVTGGGAWLFTPSLGVRILDFDAKQSSQVSDGLISGNMRNHAEFVGAGPRLGIEARRYLGAARTWSLFFRGDGSLLMGSLQSTSQFGIDDGVDPFDALVRNRETTNVTIAAFEVGGSWQPTERLNISAGYLFQTWFWPTTDNPLDTSYDGLFVRAGWNF